MECLDFYFVFFPCLEIEVVFLFEITKKDRNVK